MSEPHAIEYRAPDRCEATAKTRDGNRCRSHAWFVVDGARLCRIHAEKVAGPKALEAADPRYQRGKL